MSFDSRLRGGPVFLHSVFSSAPTKPSHNQLVSTCPEATFAHCVEQLVKGGRRHAHVRLCSARAAGVVSVEGEALAGGT